MKRSVICILLSIAFLLACCPCKQIPSEFQRQPQKRQFSHGYIPTSLDSLLLFNAWDGRSCLALDSFFQLWDNQSRVVMAQSAAPDDTMKAVYDLFELLFSEATDSATSKYVALQESVLVTVVDSETYAFLGTLAFYERREFHEKSGPARAFRSPINAGKPILCGLPEFHKALKFLFLEDDEGRLLDVENLHWETVFAKSNFLDPYLQVRPDHWGIVMLTCSDPIMPSVLFDEKLSKAMVEFQSWGCGGTWEYTRQDSIWVKSREINFWIE
ncbi:MAG: hypothetical protein IPH75_12400 [bacterium]|nr:hypothetical protein [bacterium]